MGSNRPRRNHYIPKMVLRNFADASGRLHVFNKESGEFYKLQPKDAFVENRLNVRHSDGGEQDDFEVEEQFSKIEVAAAPAIREFICSARNGDCSNLSPMHLQAWKRFFFTSFLRTPENATQILNDLGSEQALYEAIHRMLKEQGLPAPDRESFDLDPQWANLKEKLRHNITANLAAGLPPQVNSELERYAQEVGLLIGIIQDKSMEFIIGSCAAVVISSQREGDPMSGTWLPISYDVAIGISPFPDRVTLRSLGAKEVQRINDASYEKSQFIAARSPSLLQPFANRSFE